MLSHGGVGDIDGGARRRNRDFGGGGGGSSGGGGGSDLLGRPQAPWRVQAKMTGNFSNK